MNTRDVPGGPPRLSGGLDLVILAGNEQFVGADYVDHAGTVGVEADLDGPSRYQLNFPFTVERYRASALLNPSFLSRNECFPFSDSDIQYHARPYRSAYHRGVWRRIPRRRM